MSNDRNEEDRLTRPIDAGITPVETPVETVETRRRFVWLPRGGGGGRMWTWIAIAVAILILLALGSCFFFPYYGYAPVAPVAP